MLNKADAVTQDQLICVYGALLWQLGKVVLRPAVMAAATAAAPSTYNPRARLYAPTHACTPDAHGPRKVFKCPEVPKVYISSFWDAPYNVKVCGEDAAKMFDRHKLALMSDLRGMPRHNILRKINQMIVRTKRVKVHACIIGHLFEKCPKMFGASRGDCCDQSPWQRGS